MSKLIILLVITVIIKQLVWIAFIPLWHFPDEQAHFGQVANSIEVEKRKPGPNLTKEILLSERILQTERDWAGNNRYTYHPEYNIPYSLSYNGFYEDEIINFPQKERSILAREEATFYPPLYYIPAVFSYKLFYNSSLFTRVFISRLINIIYTLALGLVAYKTFELVFSKPKIAFLGAVIVVFHPMLSFIEGGINSDNLFILIFSLGILVSVKVLKDGLTLKQIVFAAIIFLLAFITKPQAYFLIPIFLIPFIYGLIRKKSKKLLFILASLTLVALFPVLNRWSKGMEVIPDIGFNMIRERDMSFSQFLIWSANHSYREVMPWYWGVFRWLSLTLPRVVNRVINRVIIVTLFGLIIYIFRFIRKRKISFKEISLFFFLYITVVYFSIITLWDYLFYITHGFSFGIQGRYFFPIIIPTVAILLFGLLGISSRLLKIAAISMIILHEISLFHVLFSYFSTSSISTFFITASQYKPWFFKSPILEYLMLVNLLTIAMIIYMIIRLRGNYEKT